MSNDPLKLPDLLLSSFGPLVAELGKCYSNYVTEYIFIASIGPQFLIPAVLYWEWDLIDVAVDSDGYCLSIMIPFSPHKVGLN